MENKGQLLFFLLAFRTKIGQLWCIHETKRKVKEFEIPELVKIPEHAKSQIVKIPELAYIRKTTLKCSFPEQISKQFEIRSQCKPGRVAVSILPLFCIVFLGFFSRLSRGVAERLLRETIGKGRGVCLQEKRKQEKEKRTDKKGR